MIGNGMMQTDLPRAGCRGLSFCHPYQSSLWMKSIHLCNFYPPCFSLSLQHLWALGRRSLMIILPMLVYLDFAAAD